MRIFAWLLLGCNGVLLACTPQGLSSVPDAAVGVDALGSDGFDQEPLTGHCFVNSVFGFSQPSSCMDINNDGVGDCAVNRAWGPLLSNLNDSMEHSVASGRSIAMIELAGIDAPFAGSDPAVTARLYIVKDADNDPTNTLCRGEGCGEVTVNDSFLVDGHTPYFCEPAPIVDERFVSGFEKPVLILFEDVEITLQQAHVSMRVPRALDGLSDGLLCGVTLARDLYVVPFPVCDYLPELCILNPAAADLSMVEYFILLGYQPDIDVDGDGLEVLALNSESVLSRCTDGDSRVIEGSDCLDDPGMQDGYSICMFFQSVPAVASF